MKNLRKVQKLIWYLCFGILSACGQTEQVVTPATVPEHVEADARTVPLLSSAPKAILQKEIWCNGVAVQSNEWLACAQKNYAISDKELNTAYNELRSLIDRQGKTLLKEAQREWIKFRDVECARKAAATHHGRAAPQRKVKCVTEITDERALLLTANIHDLQKPVALPPLLEQIRTLQVSPLCIPISDHGAETGTEFSIENCEADITVVQRVKEGKTHSVDYTYGNLEEQDQSPLRRNYTVLGVLRDKLFLSAYFASDGTHATSLTLKVEQVGDQLRVAHTYAFGFACYGGLESFSVSDGRSHYTTNLPRHELINLASGKEWINNYSFPDNPRLPETCFALEEYEDDILKGVRFSDDFVARMSEDTYKEANRPEQYCFDAYFVKAYKAGKVSYTISELKPIIKELKRTCIL